MASVQTRETFSTLHEPPGAGMSTCPRTTLRKNRGGNDGAEMGQSRRKEAPDTPRRPSSPSTAPNTHQTRNPAERKDCGILPRKHRTRVFSGFLRVFKDTTGSTRGEKSKPPLRAGHVQGGPRAVDGGGGAGG